MTTSASLPCPSLFGFPWKQFPSSAATCSASVFGCVFFLCCGALSPQGHHRKQPSSVQLGTKHIFEWRGTVKMPTCTLNSLDFFSGCGDFGYYSPKCNLASHSLFKSDINIRKCSKMTYVYLLVTQPSTGCCNPDSFPSVAEGGDRCSFPVFN